MTLESKNMLSMKKLTFVAEDWQMPWYHLFLRCCSALANETQYPGEIYSRLPSSGTSDTICV